MPDKLPKGWVKTTLGEVVDILDSQRVPVNSEERSFRRGTIPYYGATGQVGWIDSHLFDEELVLLGEDGAPFLDASKPKAYIIQGKSWVNNHAHVLRARYGILNSFVLHQLNQVDYLNFISGTTRMKLPQGSMRRIPLVVAPTHEQERIVAKLDALLSRVAAGEATVRRALDRLQRYRAAVLHAAVTGELTRDWRKTHPPEETGKQLLQHLLKARRAHWSGKGAYKDPVAPRTTSPLELPNGWCRTTLDVLAEIKGGITKDQKRRFTTHPRSVPYLRVANVQRGSLDLTEVKEIMATEEEIQELALKLGDLLFNEGGDRDKLGRGWVWNGELPECIHQNHVFRARLFCDEINPKVISWYANTLGQKFFFDEGKHTTNLASISMTKLKGLPVPIAPAAEQKQIAAEVERRLAAADQLAATLQRQLARARALRQSLLREAFAGRLVPQDPREESAAVLLERLRAAPAGRVPSRGNAGFTRGDRSATPNAGSGDPAHNNAPLRAVRPRHEIHPTRQSD